MAIEEEKEVNSNSSYEELQEAFGEFYIDLEKLGLKNAIIKKKFSFLQNKLKENFEIVKKIKLDFEKKNKILEKKNE